MSFSPLLDLYAQSPGLPPTEKVVPRLVVGDTGTVVYASEGFEQLVHAGAYALEGTRLQDLIIFCDPDTALLDRPFAAMGGDGVAPSWCTAIESGVHNIFLRDRGDQVFAFQFDWVRTSGGTAPHLIITLNESGEEEKPISPLMAQNLITAKQKPTPTPANKPLLSYTPPLRLAFMAARPKDMGAHRDTALFFDLSDEMMVCAQMDGTLTRANPAFLDMVGAPTAKVPTLHFLDMIHEEDRSMVRTMMMDMHHHTGPNTMTVDARIIGANQKTFDATWRIRRRGETLFIIGRDVTAMRENQTRFLRHQQQLSEAEAIAHMGYWRWTIGDPVMTWSDEIYRIFGVEKGVFIPTFDTVNAMLHRADVGRMGQVFQRAMMEQNTYEMDFCLTRPGGETRYVRCEGRCETDDNDETIALFGIMQDITERTRVENELRESKENAERAYASKSKFLANMSHELRTPLNAIIGFSEMMQRQLLGPIGTPKYLDYIDGIRQSGEHLLDLISDILDMSKIEAGKYKLDLEEVNITKIMRLAIGMTEGRARESSVDLSAGDIADDIRIMADRRAVLQMMLNLLSNAIKFTNSGGSVRVTLSHDSEKVTFQVTDTGIGIPANMLHTIARPFEQAANQYTRAHEGSGLGLSITKELCMMHGGNLDIQSEVGKGTCVTITLPIAEA